MGAVPRMRSVPLTVPSMTDATVLLPFSGLVMDLAALRGSGTRFSHCSAKLWLEVQVRAPSGDVHSRVSGRLALAMRAYPCQCLDQT